jgi:hypothetical protein
VCVGCRQERVRQALLAADIGGPDLSHKVSKQNRACSIVGKDRRVEVGLVIA